jgi:hypothetical protein
MAKKPLNAKLQGNALHLLPFNNKARARAGLSA